MTPAEDWQGWNSYAAWCHLWQLQIPLLLRRWRLRSCGSSRGSQNIRQNEKAWAINPRWTTKRYCVQAGTAFQWKCWCRTCCTVRAAGRTEKTIVHWEGLAGIAPTALSGQRVWACARCAVGTSRTPTAPLPCGGVSSYQLVWGIPQLCLTSTKIQSCCLPWVQRGGNCSAAGTGQSNEATLKPAQFAANRFAGVMVGLAWAINFTAVEML